MHCQPLEEGDGGRGWGMSAGIGLWAFGIRPDAMKYSTDAVPHGFSERPWHHFSQAGPMHAKAWLFHGKITLNLKVTIATTL